MPEDVGFMPLHLVEQLQGRVWEQVQASMIRQIAQACGVPGFDNADSPKCVLPGSCVEIEATLRIIDHPHGVFVRSDGTRYDLCVMELMHDPSIIPPANSELLTNDLGEPAHDWANIETLEIGRPR